MPQISDLIGGMRKNDRAARATTTPQINDLIGGMRKVNRAARAARTFKHCALTLSAKQHREISKFKVLMST